MDNLDTPVAPVPTETQSEAPSREELIGTAERAIQDEESGAHIETVDMPDPKVEQPTKSVGNRLAQLLKAREEENKNRSVYTQKRQEVEREQAELMRVKVELEAERQRFAKLKKSPIEAFKEIGWGAEDIQRAVLEDGTPEGREKAKYLSEIEDLRNKQKALEDAIKEQREYAAKQEEAKQGARRENAVKQFLNFTQKESCPNLRYLYDDTQVVQVGDSLAHQYTQKTGKVLGEEAELRQLSEYIEADAAEKIDNLLYQLHAEGALQDRLNQVLSKRGKPKGVATKPKANASHTLRAVDAAERKTQPQSLESMSPTDMRAYLASVAEEAMRHTK